MVQAKHIGLTVAALTLLAGAQVSAHEISANINAKADVGSTTLKAGVKANIEQRIEDQKNLRNEMVAERLEKKEAQAQKIQEKRQEHAAARTAKAADHLSKNVDRLIEIKTRLTAQLEKFKARGINVSTSESILASFDETVTKAKVDIAAFKATSSTEATSTTTATEPSKKAKDLFKAAQDSVKVVHKVLVDATKALKPGQNKVSASSTVEVNQ